MKKEIVMASMAMLLASAANAQENTTATQNEQQVQTEQQAEKKDGFFKRAFRDMKESARLQRKIDKANYEATKLESKAFYEEQKAMRNPQVRKGVQEKEYRQKMEEAKARQEAAQKRIDEAKGNK